MPDGNFRDEDLKAPLRLLTALREASQPPIFVPPALDESLVRSVRRHFSPPKPGRPWWWRTLAWSAGAAILLVIFLWTRHPALSFDREDLNHDGRVDILDAFMLAREIQSGQRPDLGRDVNGDGKVDQSDVERIALDAVKLRKGRRS